MAHTVIGSGVTTSYVFTPPATSHQLELADSLHEKLFTVEISHTFEISGDSCNITPKFTSNHLSCTDKGNEMTLVTENSL